MTLHSMWRSLMIYSSAIPWLKTYKRIECFPKSTLSKKILFFFFFYLFIYLFIHLCIYLFTYLCFSLDLCSAYVLQPLWKDKTLTMCLLLFIFNNEFRCTLSFSLSELKTWMSWNIIYIPFYVKHIIFSWMGIFDQPV